MELASSSLDLLTLYLVLHMHRMYHVCLIDCVQVLNQDRLLSKKLEENPGVYFRLVSIQRWLLIKEILYINCMLEVHTVLHIRVLKIVLHLLE